MADDGGHADPRRSWAPRVLAGTLLTALLAVAIGGFVVTRRVVDQEQRRALGDRAATIEANLATSEQSTVTSLRVLGDVAGSREAGAPAVFRRVAREQLATASGVGAAVRLPDGGYRVTAGVGSAVAGQPVPAGLVPVLDRAQGAQTFVAGVVSAPRSLVTALDTGRALVFQTSELPPEGQPVPNTQEAFRDLQIALYADPAGRQLALTTAPLPFRGTTTRRPVAVGADTWLLVVASDHPLTGDVTNAVPWVLLGAGLLTTALAAAVIAGLARRRLYAERLVAERTAELEDAHAFQQSLLTQGPVVVTRARLEDLAITYLSPNAERILGIPTALSFPDAGARARVVHPDDHARALAALRQVASGEVPSATVVSRVETTEGELRRVEATIVPDRAADGTITGVLSYGIDVEERHRAEEELREARAVAESANRAKSEFLSRMSHELRTPMNAVLGFGQLLERDDTLSEDQLESVDYIMKGGRHLLSLIDEVLDISRIEAGTMTLSPEPVAVADVVGEALQLVRPLAQERGVRLEAPEEPTSYLLADHQRTKQVLLNLLSNAVKYNHPHGEVRVSVHEDESTVEIVVSDTGPGIPEEKQALLFVPFERLGAEASAVEGTGMGLALSRQLAEAMGGALEAESEAGRGSIFRLSLPRTSQPHVPPPTRNGKDHTVPSTLRSHVLQIEDNPSNSRLMERVLEDLPDVELVVAGTGQLGLDLAQQHRPRLVLLDLHLPDITGEEVLRRLKHDPRTLDIPVVVVSADGTHGQETRLREAGAAGYLTKPFDVAELLQVVREAVRT